MISFISLLVVLLLLSAGGSGGIITAVEAFTVLVASSLTRAPTGTRTTATPRAPFFLLKSTAANNNESTTTTNTKPTASSNDVNTSNKNNILILDHLNINHEKGRHDLVKGFYIDLLQCSIDPRKIDNVKKGTKTIWMNIGAQQFHLPEGKPSAQVLDGLITLMYPNIDTIIQRYNHLMSKTEHVLQQTNTENNHLFSFEIIEECSDDDDDDDDSMKKELMITDPWGTTFRIVEGGNDSVEEGGMYSYGCRDPRGRQPGDISEGYSMCDLTINVPNGCNLDGIGRFYTQILGAQLLVDDKLSHDSIKVLIGQGYQTLTFQCSSSTETTVTSHVDLSDESDDEQDERAKQFVSNYGPHISMYVADIKQTYTKALELGVTYVNPRFKRRAYTLDEVLNDCMFRCLNIIDPANPNDGPIIQLEHEIRSCVQKDGITKYKSCPFDDECIPKLNYN